MADLFLQLRDLSPLMAEAWEAEFSEIESVAISCGDIFSTAEGTVPDDAPIDIKVDAVVSPANSFGFMDGGIDAVYSHVFGDQLQANLQDLIDSRFDGELLVGQAAIVATGNEMIPWCVSAPTMRTPQDVSDSVNAYLALSAALHAVIAHNESRDDPIRSVLCPGLGTAVGRMPVQRCARQMRAAWNRVLGPGLGYPSRLSQAAQQELWLRR